ncbi:MAG: cytochrome b/b6 domain-containing protein, partial [Alphaproteobacteria bacterium]
VLSGEEDGILYVVHVACGVGAGMIVLFRLAWGVVGNEHARFGDFVFGWRRVRNYAGELVRLRPPPFVGHNPLGGWMVVALLVVVGLCAFTGMEAGGLLGPGPAGVAEEVHEALGSLIQIMIFVHFAGVLVDWLLTGDNLIAAMISGRKRVPGTRPGDGAAPRDARGGNVWLALALAIPLVVFGGWLFATIDPSTHQPRQESHERD